MREAMSSETFMRLIRAAVSQALPALPTAHADKSSLLSALMQTRGPGAVFEVGLSARALPSHPVLSALVRGETPPEVVRRWMLLERFGHARHRTCVVASDAASCAQPSLLIHHYALDGGPIEAADDLFIWGVLVALMERAGFCAIEARLMQPHGEPSVLYAGAQAQALSLPAQTATLTLSWRAQARVVEDAHALALAEVAKGGRWSRRCHSACRLT